MRFSDKNPKPSVAGGRDLNAHIQIETTAAGEQDWHTRLVDAQARLAELRNARGVARLDGKAFDDREITKAEAELDAVKAAQVENTRRSRESVAEAHRKAQAARRAKLSKLHEKRLQAIEDAENACVGLMLALKQLQETDHAIRAVIADLGYRQPMAMTEMAVRDRITLRIGDVLSAASPFRGGKFGRLTLPSRCSGPRLADGTRRSDSWRETELAAAGTPILNIIKEVSPQ